MYKVKRERGEKKRKGETRKVYLTSRFSVGNMKTNGGEGRVLKGTLRKRELLKIKIVYRGFKN